MSGAQFAIGIEGVGRVTGLIDRQYLFCSGDIPSWDTDAVFVPSLEYWPAELSESVHPESGRQQTGGGNFKLLSQALTQQGATVSSLLYNQSRARVAQLSASMSSTVAAIALSGSQATTLAGQTIYLEREAIYLVSHLGGGSYTCDRGRLGTRADSHDTSRFTSVYLRSTLDVIPWRTVTYYRVPPTATSYNDLVEVRSYLLKTIDAPAPHRLVVYADAMLQAILGAEILRDRWIGTLDTTRRREQDGPPQTAGPYVGEGTPSASSPSAYFSWEGKAVTQGSYSTRNGVTSAFYRLNDLMPRSQSLEETPKRVWECYACTGEPDTNTDSLPLSKNLITRALQILTSTRSGFNGAYDTGDFRVGLGIDASKVDIAGAERIRERTPSLNTDTDFLGVEEGPVNAMRVLVEALLPHNVYVVDQGNKIGFLQLVDADADVTTTLTQTSDIIGPGGRYGQGEGEAGKPPSQTLPPEWQVDEAVVRYDYRPGAGTTTRTFVDDSTILGGIMPWGSVRAVEYALDGYSVDEGAAKARAVALGRIQRFHRRVPVWDFLVPRGRTLDLPLGARVKVTHDKLYQSIGGTRGLTEASATVIGRTESAESGIVAVRLAWFGAIYPRTGLIAPSAVVQGWDAGNLELAVYANEAAGGFASGLTEGYTTDNAGFQAGYVVDICDERGLTLTGGAGLTVVSVGGNNIELSAAPTTAPTDGDIVRLAVYSPGRAQNDLWAHLSDAATPLTLITDLAYHWTGP